MEFKKNSEMTLGVEVELQLVDQQTLNLRPVGPELIKKVRSLYPESRVKAEIFKSMLEIDTPICRSAKEAASFIQSDLEYVIRLARSLDAYVMMSGTHPFADYRDRLLSDDSRYYELVDRNQWITRRLQIFGIHMHLGMRDGEHCIQMMNALSHYLPLVLAFSTSSPFWHGEDTGLSSARITLFEALPTGGHPCLTATWSEFESLVSKLLVSKSIRSLKDLWWDIRPSPEYGTLEVRIADCPPTIAEIRALVAIVHSLALWIDKDLQKGKRFSPPPDWILRENKWRASRHGTNADLIVDDQGSLMSCEKLWASLVRSFESSTLELEALDLASTLTDLLKKGTSADRQRKVAMASDLKGVVRHLVQETETFVPIWE